MRVHLVDGTYELFRQHFGRMMRDDPRENAATIGVLRSTLALLEEGATHVAVASDHIIESFRNDLWPGYKSSVGMPPELLSQLGVVEEALEAMGVTVWAMVEHEADDALGAAALVADGDESVEQVLILTPDKDLGQCVRGRRVVQFDRRKRELIDHDGVVAKFGVEPASIPDYLGLVGDSSDGFPGLPGWGRAAPPACWLATDTSRRSPQPPGSGTSLDCAGRSSWRPRCRTTSSWRCCSATSPPSSPTSTSARSTRGAGRGRRRRSPLWPNGYRRPSSSPGLLRWRHGAHNRSPDDGRFQRNYGYRVMSTDELDEYEGTVDHDEALVTEFEDERVLSDGDELADADAERDATPFDETRCIYTGVLGNADDVDVRELRSAGALLDDPELDDDD